VPAGTRTGSPSGPTARTKARIFRCARRRPVVWDCRPFERALRKRRSSAGHERRERHGRRVAGAAADIKLPDRIPGLRGDNRVRLLPGFRGPLGVLPGSRWYTRSSPGAARAPAGPVCIRFIASAKHPGHIARYRDAGDAHWTPSTSAVGRVVIGTQYRARRAFVKQDRYRSPQTSRPPAAGFGRALVPEGKSGTPLWWSRGRGARAVLGFLDGAREHAVSTDR